MDELQCGAERRDPAPRDATLLTHVAEMLREDDRPVATAVKLAKPSFGLCTGGAERATLAADSAIDRAAPIVRVDGSTSKPRVLSFESPRLAVEMQVDFAGRYFQILGQLIPAGPGRIEVRQQPAPEWSVIDADHLGRFLVENVLPGPTSLTCHRAGQPPVATEWTRL